MPGSREEYGMDGTSPRTQWTSDWIALGLACAIVASSAIGMTVRYFTGLNFTVAGVVVDGHSHHSVHGVLIEAVKLNEPTITARSGAHGGFTLPEVPKGATIRFTAANYVAASVPASPDVRVTMRPIPVSGTVTSAFTGKGLRATYAGRVSGQTAPNGAFTVYGIGPGDKLAFSANAHESTSVTIDASRKVQLKLALAPTDPLSLLRVIPGYAHENAPASAMADIRNQMGAIGGRVITGIAGRGYTKNNQPVAVAVVIAVDPKIASSPGVRDEFFTEVAEGLPSSKLVVGGVTVERVSDAGAVLYAWQSYAAFAIVIGEPGPSETVMRAMILGVTQKA
jgi:hypothetical protein